MAEHSLESELAGGNTLGFTIGIGAGCIGYAWEGIVVGVGIGFGCSRCDLQSLRGNISCLVDET